MKMVFQGKKLKFILVLNYTYIFKKFTITNFRFFLPEKKKMFLNKQALIIMKILKCFLIDSLTLIPFSFIFLIRNQVFTRNFNLNPKYFTIITKFKILLL